MENKQRNEFLEKFRKDNRLDTLNSNNKINASQYSVRTSKSNIKLNNNSVYQTTEAPRRWDYLYQLDKVNQNKIKSKVLKKKEENELKLQQECTFSPIIYTKKRTDRSKSTGRIGSSAYTNTNENKVDNIIDCDVNQRTLIHYRKKEIKTENIKQSLRDREIEECFFKPRIVSKYINIYQRTTNMRIIKTSKLKID